MRGRRGGFIGTQATSGGGQLPGVWRASDILTLQRLSAWPNNTISATASPATIDVTETGQAQIVASVTSPYPETTYRWERSNDDGQSWENVVGQTGLILNLSGQTTSNDEDLYRVVATAGVRQGLSSPVAIRRETSINFFFSSQPQNSTAFAGETVTIFASASATGTKYGGSYQVAYQWQSSSDNGVTWSNIPGENQFLIELTTTSGMNGRRYRVQVSSAGATANSSAMTLTVNSIQVTVSPEVANMTNTGSATFEATYATLLPSPVLQWERSLNNGATWVSITGSEVDGFGNQLYQTDGNLLILNHLQKNQDHWRYRAVVYANNGLSAKASSHVRADWEEVNIIWSVQPQGGSGPIGTNIPLEVDAYAVGKTTGQIYTENAKFGWERLTKWFQGDLADWQQISAAAVGNKTYGVVITEFIDIAPDWNRFYRAYVFLAGSSSQSATAAIIRTP